MMSPKSEFREMPLVSVVIPAYNAERWIGETICSVQTQTHRNLEIIVVDDGSTDNLSIIVEAMAQKDERIRLVRKKNGGLSTARNTGIYEAKGDYIAPVDADDLWYPKKVEKQLQRFLTAEESGIRLGLVYCWSQSIDEGSKPTRPKLSQCFAEGDVFEQLSRHNFTSNGSSAMMPKDVVIDCGAYPEHMKSGCEDLALHLRIASKYPFGVVPEIMVGYRQLQGSMSRDLNFMLKGYRELLQYLEVNNSPVSKTDSDYFIFWLFIYQLARPKLLTADFWNCLFRILKIAPLFLLRPRTINIGTKSIYYKFIKIKRRRKSD